MKIFSSERVRANPVVNVFPKGRNGEGTGSMWLKHRGRMGAAKSSAHKVHREREANLLGYYRLC